MAKREYYKPLHVGVHCKNRDGTGLNGERIEQLLESFSVWGFLIDEANHDVVLVLEKKRSLEITLYTQAMCRRDKRLMCAPEETAAALAGGTVAHSHIYQVLRNILLGAPSGVKKFTDERGRLSLEKIRTEDPALYEACQTGLLCEQLSPEIDDVPDGLRIIQASCNRKNELAMHEHEVQVLARVNNACLEATAASEDMGGKVVCSFTQVKDRVQLFNPDLVQTRAFVGLFAFCTDLGIDSMGGGGLNLGTSSGIQSLIAFHREWVNPKVRRLRLDALASLHTLGSRRPFLKVAIPKAAYATLDEKYITEDQKIEWFTPKDLRQASERAEEALRFFHVDAAASIAAITTDVDSKMNEIDVAIARSFIGKETEWSVEQAAGHFYVELGKVEAHSEPVPEPADWFTEPEEGGGNDDEGDDDSSSNSTDACGVATFANGVAVEAKDKKRGKRSTHQKELTWVDQVAEPLPLAAAREEIFSALWMAQKHIGCKDAEDVKIIKEKGKPAKLVASRDLPERAVCLVPVVASSLNIVATKKGATAIALPDSALAGTEEATLWLIPSWADPKEVPARSAGKTNQVLKAVFRPPFWAVRTTKKEDEATCSIVPKRIHGVRTCGANNDQFTVSIPVLENHMALDAGAEFLRYVPKSGDKTDKVGKHATWVEHAEKKVRAREIEATREKKREQTEVKKKDRKKAKKEATGRKGVVDEELF